MSAAAERREGGRIAATTVARARRPGSLGEPVERREEGRRAATTVARARRPGLLGEPVERREVVIAGGGFGGSVLARALHAQGRDVLLLERGRHPRFALGESST
ncbi:MAG: NAD(P)-binding protein, partial [Acidobacteria bacterium]|nr:NAD(P)-binding protein [Acidobacteriota bacterium]